MQRWFLPIIQFRSGYLFQVSTLRLNDHESNTDDGKEAVSTHSRLRTINAAVEYYCRVNFIFWYSSIRWSLPAESVCRWFTIYWVYEMSIASLSGVHFRSLADLRRLHIPVCRLYILTNRNGFSISVQLNDFEKARHNNIVRATVKFSQNAPK